MFDDWQDAYAVTRQTVTVRFPTANDNDDDDDNDNEEKKKEEEEKLCLERLRLLVGDDGLLARGLRVEDVAVRGKNDAMLHLKSNHVCQDRLRTQSTLRKS